MGWKTHCASYEAITDYVQNNRRFACTDDTGSGRGEGGVETSREGGQNLDPAQEKARRGPTSQLELSNSALDSYTGKYSNEGGSNPAYSIQRLENTLWLHFNGRPVGFELVAQSKSVFALKRTAGQVEFDVDASGSVAGFTFTMERSRIRAVR